MYMVKSLTGISQGDISGLLKHPMTIGILCSWFVPLIGIAPVLVISLGGSEESIQAGMGRFTPLKGGSKVFSAGLEVWELFINVH